MSEPSKSGLPDVDELLALLPAPTVVDCGGVMIAIPVLTFGQTARIMATMRPILAQTPAARPFPEVVLAHLDAVLDVLAIALNWPAENVAALPPDTAVQVVLALFEANLDFFVLRAPGLLSEAERVATRAGQMSSNFSFPMAIRTSLQ